MLTRACMMWPVSDSLQVRGIPQQHKHQFAADATGGLLARFLATTASKNTVYRRDKSIYNNKCTFIAAKEKINNLMHKLRYKIYLSYDGFLSEFCIR
jgi:hypothetical protein